MRPLRYFINVTLDGCVDHRAVTPDLDTHRHAMETIARADALLFGRVTYEMMQDAWRPPASEAMPEWTQPFARTMHRARKYVLSSTLDEVDWNAELPRGDLTEAVQRLKDPPGEGLLACGVTFPRRLAELGLIDEYEFLVHPNVAGHGPRLFEGAAHPLELDLAHRDELPSGAVLLRYVPKR